LGTDRQSTQSVAGKVCAPAPKLSGTEKLLPCHLIKKNYFICSFGVCRSLNVVDLLLSLLLHYYFLLGELPGGSKITKKRYSNSLAVHPTLAGHYWNHHAAYYSAYYYYHNQHYLSTDYSDTVTKRHIAQQSYQEWIMKAGVEQAWMTSGRTSAVREVTAQSARNSEKLDIYIETYSVRTWYKYALTCEKLAIGSWKKTLQVSHIMPNGKITNDKKDTTNVLVEVFWNVYCMAHW